MSKSKKNTIDPEIMIENYGADAVRFFILSDSPPEKDVQWSEQGMLASYKFIQKFWKLNSEIFEVINKNDNSKKNKDEINIFTNEIIKRITFNLENFNYNVIIANFHEIHNFFYRILQDKNFDVKELKTNFIKILKSMQPILPHLISECLTKFNEKFLANWPKIDDKYLEQKKVNIVVQINGKKRGVIFCRKDIMEKELVGIIKIDKDLRKYFDKKKITKNIYVKNKIINFLLK